MKSMQMSFENPSLFAGGKVKPFASLGFEKCCNGAFMFGFSTCCNDADPG